MSQLASTKVFAIPELLEMILLQLSSTKPTKHNNSTHTTTDSGISYDVVHQLHAVRRVNCTFNREILGNMLLAQRMLLEPTPQVTARNEVVHATRPLRWFLNHIGLGEITSPTYADFRDGFIDIPTIRTHDFATGPRRECLKSITKDEASWKQLKWLEAPTPCDLLVAFNVQFATRGPRATGYKPKDLRCYQQRFVFHSGDVSTLGDVWNFMVDYVKLSREAHWKNYKEWQQEEAGNDWEG
ncbi:unnamed protein product [Zymoseptoria tritici ST99CH_1A5]|uniref:Uncharacterized protein n=4 Tax=Zymoseptoria tritici TaxID=1047171 RepID=F9XH97_ZYMTI|nr:uncharacterized protein MYCGRDRAFT_95088 [Zymoseptoria tritici IPO323]SMQ53274.1 unnamed protein product [Zymoseptoria tritici ST99CH_3D7]SMR56854.1 unnamed protein product [Zymoseptoria tritici ST99CH_1E4]SMR59713.1 unnamed protein product [Zymoseptoria tritici ST99CH_3D1]SMY26902.1 unnamed protein product [Zymoseptoria tritici ST99CH_1A5]EGP85406.1 hypothetical protein MYCGRDRAFT_95088 [Zymoseptoria tritici IPO323]